MKIDLEEELWKIIPQSPNYQISNQGRVRRLYAYGHCKALDILKPSTFRGGYCGVCLRYKGVQTYFYVHILVMENFICKRPRGLIAMHLNNDKLNNAWWNLCWGTPKENTEHMVQCGRQRFGGKNPNE